MFICHNSDCNCDNTEHIVYQLDNVYIWNIEQPVEVATYWGKMQIKTVFKMNTNTISGSPETYLTTAQVGEMLGVSYLTLYRWRKNGYLKPVSAVGRSFRYKMSEIESLLTGERVQE